MALAHAASAEKIHVPSLVLMPPDAKTSALVMSGMNRKQTLSVGASRKELSLWFPWRRDHMVKM